MNENIVSRKKKREKREEGLRLRPCQYKGLLNVVQCNISSPTTGCPCVLCAPPATI